MFRAIILPIFRSTRLCVTACGIMHPRCCRSVAGNIVVHHTTSCNTQSSALEDGKNNCTKRVELTGIINKPLLLLLVVCIYYLYFIIFFLRLAKQSQFIPFWFVKYSHFTYTMCYYLNVQFQGQRVNAVTHTFCD